MANHKRRGPKSTRSGCLLCKPHKHQAESRLTRQELKAQVDEAEGRDEAEEHEEAERLPARWPDGKLVEWV